MSRLKELKKQYPELNISIIDLFAKLDGSKTYKYLPLICKILGERFKLQETFKDKDEFLRQKLEYQANLINNGISIIDLSDNEIFVLNYFCEFFPREHFQTLKEFMYYMEKNQIENKDVTSYANMEELRGAVTLASLKGWTKELEGQIIKEYEDETWICVRPLTFSASAKYGAGTRWCTTYKKEKNYFEKYWRGGVLVYFINKKTGYKFAGFRDLINREMSFWSADDQRIDYLEVEVDDYMFSIVRNIFKSDKTNKNLSSDKIQEQVHIECLFQYEKTEVQLNELYVVEEPTEEPNQELIDAAENYRNVTMTAVPRFTEPENTRG